MFAFLAKWLAFEAIKQGIKTMVFKTLINPSLDKLTRKVGEYIDDPTTDGDEKLEAALNGYVKHVTKKWVNKAID